MTDHPGPPVRTLSAREAGVAEQTLYEGVPPHLDGPLRAWAREFITGGLAQRVALRMRITTTRSEVREALDATQGRSGHLIEQLDGRQLLDAIDLSLQLDRHLASERDELAMAVGAGQAVDYSLERLDAARILDRLLRDGDSIYTVTLSQSWPTTPTMLIRRVDATVAAAAEHTIAATDPTTGLLLRTAWNKSRQLHPDTAAAYDNAIRAVEQVLCPLVRPDHPTPTLSDVIRRLDKDHREGKPGDWVFALSDRRRDPSVDPLVGLIQRLWQGHHARHGGPANYGPPTPAEATAAVHLAVTVVALVNDGALTRRATP